jgi:hypothetical protein
LSPTAPNFHQPCSVHTARANLLYALINPFELLLDKWGLDLLLGAKGCGFEIFSGRARVYLVLLGSFPGRAMVQLVLFLEIFTRLIIP